MSEMMYVLAASYDDVEDAKRECDALRAAHAHVGTSSSFDASVLARDADGKVDIVNRDDEVTRHKTMSGAGWGLAIGAVAALFPAVGIIGALAAGGGAGAALGRIAGHASRALSRDDLKVLGDVLDRGAAGLVVVYGPDMADQVAANVTAATAKVRRSTSFAPEQIAADLAAAGDH